MAQLHNLSLMQETGIDRKPYDAGLIPRLIDDNKLLLTTYQAIRQALAAQNAAELGTLLKCLRCDLQASLLTKNTRLYQPLAQRFVSQADELERIVRLKDEMMDFVMMAMDIMKRYAETALHSGNIEAITYDLQAVGSALHDRIKKEEEGLHPLYTSLK